MKQNGDTAKLQSTDHDVILAHQNRAFFTMDIVGDRKIKQVWSLPARAHGDDLGLTVDSEYVTMTMTSL